MNRRHFVKPLLIAVFCVPLAAGDPPPAGMYQPAYNGKGQLVHPPDTRQWTFVGASIGLSYATAKPQTSPGLIHNVHVQPEAYRHYQKTGRFPEKTMFVLTLYKPEQKVSPNLHGYFQTELVATEVSVKDAERFKEGWAYFDFRGGADRLESAAAQPADKCHACHLKNAKDDNVFVQFYPVLRRGSR